MRLKDVDRMTFLYMYIFITNHHNKWSSILASYIRILLGLPQIISCAKRLREEAKFGALSLLILRTNFSLKEVCDIIGKDWCSRC